MHSVQVFGGVVFQQIAEQGGAVGGGGVHDAGVLGVVGSGEVKSPKSRRGKSIRGAPNEPDSRRGVFDGGDIGIIVTKAKDVKACPRAAVAPADTEDSRIVKRVYPEPIVDRGYAQFQVVLRKVDDNTIIYCIDIRLHDRCGAQRSQL